MRKILVTGGAGYIGSFIVRELAKNGFVPVIVDNLTSGHKTAVMDFPLYELDLVKDKKKVDRLFKKENFSGVIHMAAYIQMGESYRDPLLYFDNNLKSAINLFRTMQTNGCRNIIFSSSAGVYGKPKNLPINEDAPKDPKNPYGETKLMIERMLYWCNKAWGLNYTGLRYFNAAGAAVDGSIGEDHPNESHLIPILIKNALEGKQSIIFGNDYSTPDGTNVRDYIHVLDLAEIHVLALKELLEGRKGGFFNTGVGKGFSNKEIVGAIKKYTDLEIKIKYGKRRPGDADSLYASNNKLRKQFNWIPKYGLKEIIETAYTWHKENPLGYKK